MADRSDARPPQPDWRTMHLWQFQPVRDLLGIAALFGLIYLGHRLSLVTVPMLLAMLLAYLFEPVVRALTKRHIMSRAGVAIAIIIGAFLVIVVPVTLGVGTAVVQSVQVAKGVARSADRVLAVVGFSQRALDPSFGTVEVKSVDGGNKKFEARFIGHSDEGRAAEEQATAAFQQMNDQLKRICIQILESNHPQPAQSQAVDTGNAKGAPGPGDAGHEANGQPATAEQATPAAKIAVQRDGVPEPTGLTSLLIPAMAWVQNNMDAIGTVLGQRALGSGADAVGAALRTVHWVGRLALTLFLTAFFFFFFSTGYGRVLSFWEGLIPERKKGRVIELLGKMDRVIAGFVRGRLTICAILMIYYTVAYWFIGVPVPQLLGPIVGAIAIVPFITTLAMPLAMLLMILDPTGGAEWQHHWWWILGGPVLAYAIERILDDYILTPLIQGKHTEMAVPAILFASLAGGVLAGVYGLLIAIPVAACLRILLKEVFWPRFEAWAAGRERDFLPIGREEDERTPDLDQPT